MAEFPGRLHKPLQIPQYNTTCAIRMLQDRIDGRATDYVSHPHTPIQVVTIYDCN